MRKQSTGPKTKSRPDRPAKCLFNLRGPNVPNEILGCPFLCEPGIDYDAANEYLEEVFSRKWYPHQMGVPLADAAVGKRLRANSPASLNQRAYKVSSFVRWSAAANLHDGTALHLSEIAETHLDQFADDMETGDWSDDGEPVSATYAGLHQLAAIDFLHWACHHGRRGPLRLTCAPSAYRGEDTGLYTASYRIVRRAAPGLVEFPPADSDIRVLKNIPDYASKLAGGLVFRAGLRAREACEVGVDQIPLSLPAPRLLKINICGKGGKNRLVVLDSALIPPFQKYHDAERPRRLAKCRDAFGERSTEYQLAKSRLFLNRRDGRALSYKAFWCAFKGGANRAGLPLLTPHGGRHWFAGSQLANKHESIGDVVNLEDQLATVLEFLRVQLGHNSIETTQIYLQSYLRKHHAEHFALPRQDALLEALKI